MIKLRSMQWMFVAAAFALAATPSAWAATADDSDSVTVTVDPVLSISDEVGDFTITFTNATGSAAGDVSTGQTVGYIVKSNTMPNAALTGALSAKLSTTLTNIEIRGTTDGTSYVNDGSASNAILEAVNTDTANPTVIGTTATSMFNKPSSTGTAGKILDGRAFINWNAKATADLVPGDGGTVTLTVTLKDA